MIKKIGLVIEGGGFRGIYTAGILDYFLEKELNFPYVIGVSMGACNGANYISKQKARSIDVPYTYIDDSRYISYRNLFFKGSLFGMKFIFDEIPNELNIFDFETFKASKQTYLITAMDVETGQSKFFDKKDLNQEQTLHAMSASCSLPFISKMSFVKGRKYLDGGLSDSIPVWKAFEDGMDKVVVLLTREQGYRKEEKKSNYGRFMYRKYPKVIEAVNNRSAKYNKELEYVEQKCQEGKALAIYPDKPIEIGRTERNKNKLMKAYEEGYEQGERVYQQVLEFINA